MDTIMLMLALGFMAGLDFVRERREALDKARHLWRGRVWLARMRAKRYREKR